MGPSPSPSLPRCQRATRGATPARAARHLLPRQVMAVRTPSRSMSSWPSPTDHRWTQPNASLRSAVSPASAEPSWESVPSSLAAGVLRGSARDVRCVVFWIRRAGVIVVVGAVVRLMGRIVIDAGGDWSAFHLAVLGLVHALDPHRSGHRVPTRRWGPSRRRCSPSARPRNRPSRSCHGAAATHPHEFAERHRFPSRAGSGPRRVGRGSPAGRRRLEPRARSRRHRCGFGRVVDGLPVRRPHGHRGQSIAHRSDRRAPRVCPRQSGSEVC